MPAQTEHRSALGLSVLDAAGGRVTWPDCAARHGRCPCTSCAPAGSTYPRRAAGGGVTPIAARVRRILGARVTVVSSDGAQAHLAAGPHRTLLLQRSGIMLAGSADVVRYRLATALPTGTFDGPALQAAIGRP